MSSCVADKSPAGYSFQYSARPIAEQECMEARHRKGHLSLIQYSQHHHVGFLFFSFMQLLGVIVELVRNFKEAQSAEKVCDEC